MSPSSHQRNCKRSLYSSATPTWWNIDSMSHIKAAGSCLNLKRTPTKLLVRSGPCNRCLFRVSSLNSAERSKTTRILLSFFTWYTPWCGIYQIFLSVAQLISCPSLTPLGLVWQLSESTFGKQFLDGTFSA